MPPFIGELVRGEGFITPPRPFTPGMDGIGVVEAAAMTAGSLPPGTLVYCNNFYTPPDPSGSGSRAFLGNFAAQSSSFLLERWPDGVYAEKVCLPLECLCPSIRALRRPPYSAGWAGWGLPI